MDDSESLVDAQTQISRAPNETSAMQSSVADEGREQLINDISGLISTKLAASGKNSDSLKQLLKSLDKCAPNKLVETLFEVSKRRCRSGALIHVQSTAAGRRRHSMYRGSAPLNPGRPKKNSTWRPTKRPHSFKNAVDNNRANAK